MKFYEKDIKRILLERYPDDDAVKKITSLEIRRVIKIYFSNVEKRMFSGFMVRFLNYSSAYYIRKYRIGEIKRDRENV